MGGTSNRPYFFKTGVKMKKEKKKDKPKIEVLYPRETWTGEAPQNRMIEAVKLRRR